MSIQIQYGKNPYVYKINEYNQRQIVRRLNRHRARWTHYELYPTSQSAYQAILEIERRQKETTYAPDPSS